MALWTLTVLTNVWRKYRSSNEYIWLTCIYFGFFMLPTQIYERYLYPAIITSVLAIAGDPRMWGIVLPLAWSYSFNIIAFTHAPFSYLGVNLPFRLGDVGLQAASVQALAFISSGVMLLSDRSSHRARFVLIPLWVAMAAIIGFTTLERLFVDWVPMSAHRINALLDGTTRLEGFDRRCEDGGVELSLYWRAIEHNNSDYAIFLHAMREGERIAQSDGRPENGEYPVWRWFADRVIVTTHMLPLNPVTGPADRIIIGWYDPHTMERVDVIENGVLTASQTADIDLGEQMGASFSCVTP